MTSGGVRRGLCVGGGGVLRCLCVMADRHGKPTQGGGLDGRGHKHPTVRTE
jgi:hypothetical protein